MTWNGKRPQRAHFPAQFAPLSPPALSCSSRRSRQALRLGHELNAQRTSLGEHLDGGAEPIQRQLSPYGSVRESTVTSAPTATLHLDLRAHAIFEMACL